MRKVHEYSLLFAVLSFIYPFFSLLLYFFKAKSPEKIDMGKIGVVDNSLQHDFFGWVYNILVNWPLVALFILIGSGLIYFHISYKDNY